MKKPINWKILIPLLILMWALVGINRMAPMFLGPFIIEEFGLSLEQFGIVVGVVAFTWALGTLFAGLLTDKFGAKPIIIIGGLLSSVFGWLSGVAGSLGQLVGIRASIGLAEGSLFAPLITTASREVPPNMKAKIVGFFFIAFMFVGMVLGFPLLTEIGLNQGWRTGFFLVSAPLFIISIILFFVLRNQKSTEELKEEVSIKEGFKEIIKNKNVLVCGVIAICIMARLFVVMTFGAIYMDDMHGIDLETAGKMIMPAAVFSEILGILIFGYIADKTGRRKSLLIPSYAIGFIGMLGFALLPTGSPLPLLILCLCVAFLFGGGPTFLAIGVIPQESVKPIYAAAAIGMTSFLGEFFGGGLFPMIGGNLGDSFGLRATMILGAVMLVIALFAALMINKTNPNTET